MFGFLIVQSRRKTVGRFYICFMSQLIPLHNQLIDFLLQFLNLKPSRFGGLLDLQIFFFDARIGILIVEESQKILLILVNLCNQFQLSLKVQACFSRPKNQSKNYGFLRSMGFTKKSLLFRHRDVFGKKSQKIFKIDSRQFWNSGVSKEIDWCHSSRSQSKAFYLC